MIERALEDPRDPRTNLTPACGNCDFLLGYKEWGWCSRWECWVHGHQDCPEWERRDLGMNAENIQISTLLDGMHSSLTILAELAQNTDNHEVKDRFKIAEMALLRFLRSLRQSYGIPYDDDTAQREE